MEDAVINQGVFLESFNDKDQLINLYYLHGFFVEVAINPFRNEPEDFTPFRQGYNIRHYREQLYRHYKHVFDALRIAA